MRSLQKRSRMEMHGSARIDCRIRGLKPGGPHAGRAGPLDKEVAPALTAVAVADAQAGGGLMLPGYRQIMFCCNGSARSASVGSSPGGRRLPA